MVPAMRPLLFVAVLAALCAFTVASPIREDEGPSRMLLGRRSSSDKSTKSTKSGDETAVQKGDDILDPQSNNPTGVRDKPVNGLIQKSSDIESTEWVESARASLADKFELAAGKAQHFELAEDEEWHALMQDWKKDLNGMPQEQLVEAGWFGSMFGGKKSAPKTKTISMDMDAAAAGGLASASLCVQAGVPSYMPTKMLGSGMKKIFDSMVLKKLAQSGLNLQPDEDTALIAEAPCDTKENNKQLFTFGTPNIPFVGKLSLTVLGSADLTGLDAIKNMAKSFGR